VTGDGLKPEITVRLLGEEAGSARAEPSEMSGRIRLVGGAMLCALALLTVRLAALSFGPDEEVRVVDARASQGPRPLVVDREGRALAMNRPVTGLGIDGRDVWDPEETAVAVARVLPGTDAEGLAARLAAKRYVHVANEVTAEEEARLVATGLPGLRFPKDEARVYPQGALAAHVLGYTVPGRGGVVGVEAAIDGTEADGPVRLTLDASVQQVVEAELRAALRTFSARAGWGVLMDVRDGSVLALASLPDFDPNAPGASEAAARRNRSMSDAYELGSAFKPITVAAAYEDGIVDQAERFDVAEPIKVGRWSIRDYSPRTDALTPSEILQYSSNIGTVRIVQRLGAERFGAYLEALSLTESLETDLPEARAPLLPARWGEAELATASYGHGIAVTPLQLTAAFAAVVNGGTYRTPRFLQATKPESTRVFSEETSASLRLALRRVLTDGTGRNAEAAGFHAIGKTATADKPKEGGYGERALVTSFVGAFPGYAPRYVLLVSLDEPQGIAETYGYATAGYTAAPVFRRIVERVAPTLGVMPVGDEVALAGFVGLDRGEVGAAPPAAAQEEPLDALAALLSRQAL
jgi:cell division protein FtsI (penicillin-binding protein 3)